MKPGADCDLHEAFSRVWSDSDWASAKDRKSQSSLKIEVDGCPLYSEPRKQKARAHHSGEAEYYAAVSAISEAMLIRDVLLFMELEVRTALLLDSAAARGICRTRVLWRQQLVKRRSVMVSACTSAENRANLGTKSLPVHRPRQLRQLNRLALNRTENSANCDGKDGQYENGQQAAAVRTISKPRQGDGGVLEALENLARAARGSK